MINDNNGEQQTTQCTKIYFGIPYIGKRSQVYARKVKEYIKPISNVKLKVFYKRFKFNGKVRKQHPTRICVYKNPFNFIYCIYIYKEHTFTITKISFQVYCLFWRQILEKFYMHWLLL